VAPATLPQLLILELQRIHWYVNVIGWVPLHDPGETRSV
jgi:hypothetical protein